MIDIIVVTPVFNACEFIKETLRSVVGQGGDFNLYFHVQDAGSTDGTQDIVSSFVSNLRPTDWFNSGERSLTYSVERDEGMYDALNKGFEYLEKLKYFDPDTTVMTWINADDILQPGALGTVASIFDQLHDVQFLSGRLGLINESGHLTNVREGRRFSRELVAAGLHDSRHFDFVNQEGTFWRAGLWRSCGGVDPKFRLAGDWDLWRRMAQFAPLVAVDVVLACFRVRTKQLSNDQASYMREIDAALDASDHEDRAAALTEYYALQSDRDLFATSKHASRHVVYDAGAGTWRLERRSTAALAPPEFVSPIGQGAGAPIAIVSGLAAPVGSCPDLDLAAGARWATDRTVAGAFVTDVATSAVVRAVLRVFERGLTCGVVVNSQMTCLKALPARGNAREVVIECPVALAEGANTIELKFDSATFGSFSVLIVGFAIWTDGGAARLDAPPIAEIAGASRKQASARATGPTAPAPKVCLLSDLDWSGADGVSASPLRPLADAFDGLASEVNAITLPAGWLGADAGAAGVVDLIGEIGVEGYDVVAVMTDEETDDDQVERLFGDLPATVVQIRIVFGPERGIAYVAKRLGASIGEAPDSWSSEALICDATLLELPNRASIRSVLGVREDERLTLLDPAMTPQEAEALASGLTDPASAGSAPVRLLSFGAAPPALAGRSIEIRGAAQSDAPGALATILAADQFVLSATSVRSGRRMRLLDEAIKTSLPVRSVRDVVSGYSPDTDDRPTAIEDVRRRIAGGWPQAGAADLFRHVGALAASSPGDFDPVDTVASAERVVVEEEWERRAERLVRTLRIVAGFESATGGAETPARMGPNGGILLIDPAGMGLSRLRLTFRVSGPARLETFTFSMGDRTFDKRRLRADGGAAVWPIDLAIEAEARFCLVIERQIGADDADVDVASCQVTLQAAELYRYKAVGGLSLLAGTQRADLLLGMPVDGDLETLSGATSEAAAPGAAPAIDRRVWSEAFMLRMFSRREGPRTVALSMTPRVAGTLVVSVFSHVAAEFDWADDDAGERRPVSFASYWHMGYNDIRFEFRPRRPSEGTSGEAAGFYVLHEVRLEDAQKIASDPHAPDRLSEPHRPSLVAIDWAESAGFSDPHPAYPNFGLHQGFRWMVSKTATLCISGIGSPASLIVDYRSIIAGQVLTVRSGASEAKRFSLETTGLSKSARIEIPVEPTGGSTPVAFEAQETTAAAESGQELAVLFESLTLRADHKLE